MPATVVREPDGSTTTSSPTRTEPEASWPAYPRYSTCSGERAAPCGRMTTCTGIRNDSCTGSVSGGRVSSSSSSEGPSYQGVFGERSTTLSPTRADTGTAWACGMPSSVGDGAHVGGDRAEDVLAVVDEVDLVDRDDDVRHPHQRGDGEVAAGLLEHPLAGVDEQHQRVGGGRAGDRVAGVLHVAGAVGEHERALRRGEVAVGDVDGDALLALGAQAVGEQREVGRGQAPVAADPLDGVELVGEHRLGVVQQAADQGGLAVVDRAGGREAQQGASCGVPVGTSAELRQLHGCIRSSPPSCGPPWRPRRSGRRRGSPRARSAWTRRPRSTTSATDAASLSTAPVHDMSPTVR